MLKVAVLDCGYGGEFLADRLEEEIGVVEVIRVIDWRHSEQYLTKPKVARGLAIAALRPYIGTVDLIIIANHLLSVTSLNYFKHKYPEQKFIGLKLKHPECFTEKQILVLATKSLTKTMAYHGFLFSLKKHKVKTMLVDTWPERIDEGELEFTEIKHSIEQFADKKNITPEEVVLANAQFEDIKSELKRVLGRKVKIHSSFDDTIREACKLLRIRGSVRKLKR